MRRPAATLLTFAVFLTSGCAGLSARPTFPVVETGIPELRQALADGESAKKQLQSPNPR